MTKKEISEIEIKVSKELQIIQSNLDSFTYMIKQLEKNDVSKVSEVKDTKFVNLYNNYLEQIIKEYGLDVAEDYLDVKANFFIETLKELKIALLRKKYECEEELKHFAKKIKRKTGFSRDKFVKEFFDEKKARGKEIKLPIPANILSELKKKLAEHNDFPSDNALRTSLSRAGKTKERKPF